VEKEASKKENWRVSQLAEPICFDHGHG